RHVRIHLARAAALPRARRPIPAIGTLGNGGGPRGRLPRLSAVPAVEGAPAPLLRSLPDGEPLREGLRRARLVVAFQYLQDLRRRAHARYAREDALHELRVVVHLGRGARVRRDDEVVAGVAGGER